MRRIIIDRAMRWLEVQTLYSSVTIFAVAVGHPETPTPTGVFYIHSKWEKGDREVEEHGKCLGTHCLTLGQFDDDDKLQPIGKGSDGKLTLVSENDICFAIHGTDEPDSIDTTIGEGCIRMYNHEIKILYGWVDVGDVVIII